MDINETNSSNGAEDGTGIVVKTEEPPEETGTVKAEPESPSGDDKINIEDVLAFLRRKGLSGTEGLLKQELGNATDDKGPQISDNKPSSQLNATGSAQTSNITKADVSGAEVSNVLSSYKSESDPSIYAEAYKDLQRFVESSLDLYRHELALILVS